MNNYKRILFTIALKKLKYLEIYMMKDVKDLHTENYKTFLRGMEEGLNKGRGTP